MRKRTSIIILLALHLSVANLLAEDKHLEDFGAETINKEIDALPLELVEEQSPPDFQPNFSSNTHATRPDHTEDKPELTTSEQMTTVLNAKDVDIAVLVKSIGKLTNRNYVLDSSVKGKVTIHLNTPVTVDEALQVFDSVLLLKGFTTVPINQNIWKVIKAKDAKQTTIPLHLEEPKHSTDALITRVLRLTHVQAEDIQKLVSQFISKDGSLSSFSGTNALIAIDSAANIKRLSQLVKLLDTPANDQDITIVPIYHADVNDIAEKIKEILGEDGSSQSSGTTRTSTTRTNTSTGRANVSLTNNANSNIQRRSTPIKIIPDERTNALIVVADEALTTRVKLLVKQLDSAVDLSGGRFYVYRVKHADASELSEILNNVISGTSGDSENNSGTSGSSISRTQANSSTTSARERIRQALLGGSAVTSNEGKVNFEGEVSVSPDPSTNSLIINASRSDYLRLKEVIDALDVKRRQVLVEATLLEISLNKEEELGIELQGSTGGNDGGVLAQTNFGGLSNLITNPAALSDLTIAAASAGTITLPGGLVIPSQAVLVNALSNVTNVNVLSSPTILAMDNEEAEIIVGENVPFVTSTSTDSANINNTFNQIERQDVGITLRITPQISSGDFVVLKIFVEISNVVAGTRNDPNGPTTTIRTTETMVEVKNNQMIVTGGLISDNITESTRGVPFLKDIPFFGNLFKTENEIRSRNNLLVFLTPKIIKDQYGARESTIKAREQISDTIAEQNVAVKRDHVLHDRKIDNVVEHLPNKESLATTITPAKRNYLNQDLNKKEQTALERTKKRFNTLAREKALERSQSNPQKTKPSSEEVLNFTVKPKLPRAALKPANTEQLSALTSKLNKETFVVLKDISSNQPISDSDIEFKYSDLQRTVGLIVKAPKNQIFFEVGKRFKYEQKRISREFICLGLFGSIEEAKNIHPSLSSNESWNKLSPQQSNSLGQNTWVRS